MNPCMEIYRVSSGLSPIHVSSSSADSRSRATPIYFDYDPDLGLCEDCMRGTCDYCQ